MRPLIVGESNPFGGDEHFALYPEPPECSGGRLCRLVMGLREATYMREFARANLVRGPWRMRAARERAGDLLRGVPALGTSRVHVLLGRKVATAFGFAQQEQLPKLEVRSSNATFVLLPHPSGLNRMWNDPEMVPACRELLRGVLPGISFGEIEQQEVMNA